METRVIPEDQSEKLCDATRKMREGALEFRDALIENSNKAIEKCCLDVQNSIKDKPYHAIMLAFAAGALVANYYLRR